MTAHQRCTHGGRECPRIHQGGADDDRTMTPSRLLAWGVVGAAMWVGIIAGIVKVVVG